MELWNLFVKTLSKRQCELSDLTVEHDRRELRRANVRDVSRDYALIESVREVYVQVCRALNRADPEDDAYCLFLSNCADDLDAFLSGMERLQEGA